MILYIGYCTREGGIGQMLIFGEEIGCMMDYLREIVKERNLRVEDRK